MTEIELLTQRIEALEQQIQILASQGSFWVTLSVEDAHSITYASIGLFIVAFLIHQTRKVLD